MHVFEFVLAIIAIVFAAKLIDSFMKRRSERNAAHDAERGEWRERIAQLEERIQVLERIVTDESADLRRQFRDLGQ